MKKRAFALILALIPLFGCANAEFYTANEDIYYHAKADCVAGSTFEISEHAARQFEKLACPVCVDRASVGGELIEIDLPEGYLNLRGVEFRDGKLLLCGCVNVQNSKPWMAMYDLGGNKLQESLGKPNDNIIYDAKFLSDGKIAVIRSLGVEEGDCLELYKDGKLVNQFEAMSYLSRIWVLEDGFLIYGSEKMYQYRLAKCDNDGNVLWIMDMTELFPLSDQQPGLTDILVGDGVHIAYGRAEQRGGSRPEIVAFDDNGEIIGRQRIERIIGERFQTARDKDGNPVGMETVDSYLGNLNHGAWAEDGVVFAGTITRPGFAYKLNAEGEAWYSDLAYLHDENGDFRLDSIAVEDGWLKDMLPWKDGYLLALEAYAYPEHYGKLEKTYMRIAYMNSEGKIIRDWFEDIGDILYAEELALFSHGEDVYLLVYGQTMDDGEAYEQGMTQPQIPRRAILKKISA